jgi:hypothetical protein
MVIVSFREMGSIVLSTRYLYLWQWIKGPSTLNSIVSEVGQLSTVFESMLCCGNLFSLPGVATGDG